MRLVSSNRRSSNYCGRHLGFPTLVIVKFCLHLSIVLVLMRKRLLEGTFDYCRRMMTLPHYRGDIKVTNECECVLQSSILPFEWNGRALYSAAHRTTAFSKFGSPSSN